MKHEWNEGVIGSEWHLRGESGQQTQTRFYTGQSVYGNYTLLRGGRKKKDKIGEEGKVLCQYLLRCFMRLLSSLLCYSIEAN